MVGGGVRPLVVVLVWIATEDRRRFAGARGG